MDEPTPPQPVAPPPNAPAPAPTAVDRGLAAEIEVLRARLEALEAFKAEVERLAIQNALQNQPMRKPLPGFKPGVFKGR